MNLPVIESHRRAAFFKLTFALVLGLALQALGAKAKPVQLTVTQPTVTTLDTSAVHATYTDGDFDQVIASLDPFLTNKIPISREESLFVFKHLGVIFSKDLPSREKGKYCFRKLFDIDANAQILDMYATDDIYAVFRTVHDEWVLSHPELAKNENGIAATPNQTAMAPAAQNHSSQPVTGTTPPVTKAAGSQSQNDEWKVWSIAGGAAIVTAGVATWFLLSQPDDKTTTTFVVDPQSPAP